MEYMRSRAGWFGVGLFITDALFFGLTNPVRVASIFLMVGFALVLVSLYWLVFNFQKIAAFYMPWLSTQKYLTLSVVLCLGTLLALQSIGQLTPRDAGLIPLAAVAIYAYLTYGRNNRTAS